jgi:hypothetical protein
MDDSFSLPPWDQNPIVDALFLDIMDFRRMVVKERHRSGLKAYDTVRGLLPSHWDTFLHTYEISKLS